MLIFFITAATFLLSWFAGMFIAMPIAREFGLDADETIFMIVGGGVPFIISLILTYVVGNVLEGKKKEALAVVGKTVSMCVQIPLALVIFGLLVWGASTFISSTPMWALVIIGLLIIIASKM